MTIPNNQFISRHFQRAQIVVASATKGRKSNELTKTIYFPKLCTQTHVILNSQFCAKIDHMERSDFFCYYLPSSNECLSLLKCIQISLDQRNLPKVELCSNSRQFINGFLHTYQKLMIFYTYQTGNYRHANQSSYSLLNKLRLDSQTRGKKGTFFIMSLTITEPIFNKFQENGLGGKLQVFRFFLEIIENRFSQCQKKSPTYKLVGPPLPLPLL